MLRFEVRRHIATKYPVRIVGGSRHRELWIPAEGLPAFNDAIVGPITVVARFGSGGGSLTPSGS